MKIVQFSICTKLRCNANDWGVKINTSYSWSLCFCVVGQPTRSKRAAGWNNERTQWLFGEEKAVFPSVFLFIEWWVAGDSEWDQGSSQSSASCQEMLWGKF